jgi:hypothetical protein
VSRGRSALAALLVGLALVAWGAPAGAVELSFGKRRARVDVTSTTTIEYQTDNDNGQPCDDDLGGAVERFNVLGFYGAWNVGLRLDGSAYFSAPDECTEQRYENQVIPEKVWVGWSQRDVEVVVGDSYVSFGRGLALSLRKVDELGVDTTLRGAKVILRRGAFGGTLIAGVVNMSNFDEASGKTADTLNDLVAGVEGTARVTDGITVGAHGVLVAFHDLVTNTFVPPGATADPDYRERWILFGPMIDAPRITPNFGLYLEGIVQRRTPVKFEFAAMDLVDQPVETGYGLYGSATFYKGPATVLLEGKAYGDLAVVQPVFDEQEFTSVQYTTPPTVERLLQPIENPQRKIVGGRGKFDWTFSPTFQGFVSYGFFRDYLGYQGPLSGEQEPGDIHDPYAGVDVRWDQARSRAIVSAGYRVVFTPDASGPTRGDVHLDYDFVQALSARFSLELHGNHLERHKGTVLGDEDWREGTAQLGVSMVRPRVSVTAILDYTTDPTQTKDIYPNGSVQWDLTSSSSVRLQAGAARGGLKCVSGVCRVFPPFEGVKLTAVLRF